MSLRIKLALVLLPFLAWPMPADAQEVKTHTWSVGPEVSYIKYKESEMKETGMMAGVFGSYTYRGDSAIESLEKLMLRAEGHFSGGQVNYDGQLSDGTPYKIKNVSDLLGEIRGLAGYDFTVLSNSTFTPYLGVGYRYLSDDLSKDSAGYLRQSNYFYSPVGFELAMPLKSGWGIGLAVEYDIFWSGWQKSNLSDVSSSLSDVTNDQKEGYGLRAAVKLSKAMDRMSLFAEPFVRYWSISKSEESTVTYAGDVIGTAVEPDNTSLEVGLKVGVEF